VALFVQLARLHDPGFDLTPGNAKSVAAICSRLDGLPLAIELAAGRLQVLSPASLLERLTPRLDLLTRGGRSLSERHQTMRSTIAWSYDQLQPFERLTFQRLAVFVGGCDLEAAEFVVPSPATASTDALVPPADTRHPTLDALAGLLDNALLRRELVAGEIRFTMLETIREYALEQLVASGDVAAVRQRHAEYFAALAEEAEPALSVGLVLGHWPDRLEHDHANLRSALAWSLDQEDPDIGLRLAAALVWFWWIRGHLVEGSAWLERALVRSQANESTLRSKLLDGAGKLARTRGDIGRAGELHEESLRIATGLGDTFSTARALANLALVAEADNHTEKATELFDPALELARASGQRELLATILTNYGLMKLVNEDRDRGIELLEEGLVLARSLGPSGFLGAILSNLGDARLEQGDQAAAALMYRECLELQAELGNKRGMADALAGIGGIVLDRGELRLAARLIASAQALYESINAVPPPPVVLQLNHALQRFRTGLDEVTLETILEAGRNADVANVIAEALELTSRSSSGAVVLGPSGQAMTGLTSRELDVLRLLAQGHSNRAIADALFISPLTAATHVKRLRAKIGVSTRTAAAAYAYQHGLT
jgi:non-specific serine/threonine protein kinase